MFIGLIGTLPASPEVEEGEPEVGQRDIYLHSPQSKVEDISVGESEEDENAGTRKHKRRRSKWEMPVLQADSTSGTTVEDLVTDPVRRLTDAVSLEQQPETELVVEHEDTEGINLGSCSFSGRLTIKHCRRDDVVSPDQGEQRDDSPEHLNVGESIWDSLTGIVQELTSALNNTRIWSPSEASTPSDAQIDSSPSLPQSISALNNQQQDLDPREEAPQNVGARETHKSKRKNRKRRPHREPRGAEGASASASDEVTFDQREYTRRIKQRRPGDESIRPISGPEWDPSRRPVTTEGESRTQRRRSYLKKEAEEASSVTALLVTDPAGPPQTKSGQQEYGPGLLPPQPETCSSPSGRSEGSSSLIDNEVCANLLHRNDLSELTAQGSVARAPKRALRLPEVMTERRQKRGSPIFRSSSLLRDSSSLVENKVIENLGRNDLSEVGAQLSMVGAPERASVIPDVMAKSNHRQGSQISRPAMLLGDSSSSIDDEVIGNRHRSDLSEFGAQVSGGRALERASLLNVRAQRKQRPALLLEDKSSPIDDEVSENLYRDDFSKLGAQVSSTKAPEKASEIQEVMPKRKPQSFRPSLLLGGSSSPIDELSKNRHRSDSSEFGVQLSEARDAERESMIQEVMTKRNQSQGSSLLLRENLSPIGDEVGINLHQNVPSEQEDHLAKAPERASVIKTVKWNQRQGSEIFRPSLLVGESSSPADDELCSSLHRNNLLELEANLLQANAPGRASVIQEAMTKRNERQGSKTFQLSLFLQGSSSSIEDEVSAKNDLLELEVEARAPERASVIQTMITKRNERQGPYIVKPSLIFGESLPAISQWPHSDPVLDPSFKLYIDNHLFQASPMKLESTQPFLPQPIPVSCVVLNKAEDLVRTESLVGAGSDKSPCAGYPCSNMAQGEHSMLQTTCQSKLQRDPCLHGPRSPGHPETQVLSQDNAGFGYQTGQQSADGLGSRKRLERISEEQYRSDVQRSRMQDPFRTCDARSGMLITPQLDSPYKNYARQNFAEQPCGIWPISLWRRLHLDEVFQYTGAGQYPCVSVICWKDRTCINSDLMMYMGDLPSRSSRTYHIKQILSAGIRYHRIRDEIFSQICKQTTNNPSRMSNGKGWQAMKICCATFPPSETMKPYLYAHLEQVAADKVANKGPADILGQNPQGIVNPPEAAAYCLSCLQITLVMGPRHLLPLNKEIQAIESMYSLAVLISLPDGNRQVMDVLPTDTSTALVRKVVTFLGLLETRYYGLFKVEPNGVEKLIPANAYIMEVEASCNLLVSPPQTIKDPRFSLKSSLQKIIPLFKYEDLDDVDTRPLGLGPEDGGPLQFPGSRLELLLKRKLYLGDLTTTMAALPIKMRMRVLHFEYCQAVHDVVHGVHRVMEDDAVMLGAMQLGADLGTNTPDPHVLANLDALKYGPKPYVQGVEDDWKAAIALVLSVLPFEDDVLTRQHDYIDFLKSRCPLYESSWFCLKVRCCEGKVFLNEETKCGYQKGNLVPQFFGQDSQKF